MEATLLPCRCRHRPRSPPICLMRQLLISLVVPQNAEVSAKSRAVNRYGFERMIT